MRLTDVLTKNPLVLAPMAGFTDLAFRLVAKDHGAGLAYTEMVSAVGLARRDARTWAYVASHPAEAPLVIQIFGHDPETLAKAAGLLEQAGAAAIDLNLGCPVKKVVRQGAGAALLRKPYLVGQIFTAVRRAVRIPLLAKLRAGFRPSEGPVALEVARMAEAEGLDGLALHPRFAKDGFSGRADWDLLRTVADKVKVPVLGSGDAATPELAAKMLRETGCAGVMIGRGAIGRPWIFRQTLDLLAGREPRPVSLEQRRRAVNRHFSLLVELHGPRVAWLKFKGLIGHYLKGLPGAREIKPLLYQAAEAEDGLKALNRFLARQEEES